MKKDAHFQDIYDLCRRHIHSYVLVELVDGNQFDGIVTGLDRQYVYFAVPIEPGEAGGREQPTRQFGGYGGHGGYGGYGGYSGYGHGYGYGPSPRRRFNRFVLPLTALAALSLLPWY